MYTPMTSMRIGPRREPALTLLLSIVTCYIYYLCYVAWVSQETQEFLGEPDTSPGLEVLLTIVTGGLYNIYWDYKMGRKIARMQEKVGLRVADNSTLYLVLDIFGLGVFNSLMQQGHLNEIWHAASNSQTIAR